MRLLDTCTGHFHEVENHFEVPYAILSHTWTPAGEQSFQDVRSLPKERSNAGAPANSRPSLLEDERLSAKIRSACRIAQQHGYRYLWLDSCCIDKTSSAELSEAINCMYSWYRDAAVCYAFLSDVPDDDRPRASHSHFRQSRWFKRGWTLQELIAPRDVIFLSSGWQVLGTKIGLDTVVEEVTGINRAVLGHQELLHEVSVARRMSWAAARECTRVEDEAYSLMGIFDINMHTLYGEGRRAFVRLQKEILKRIPDQSLFAWGIPCLTALSLPPVLPPRSPVSDN
ncbi:HET-domain-containing protein, partial [Polyporus arcularius HHB13444]